MSMAALMSISRQREVSCLQCNSDAQTKQMPIKLINICKTKIAHCSAKIYWTPVARLRSLSHRKKSTIRHLTIFSTHDNPYCKQPLIQKRYLQCTREKREISRETVLVSCETSLVSRETSLVSRDTSLVSRETVVTYIWAVLYSRLLL